MKKCLSSRPVLLSLFLVVSASLSQALADVTLPKVIGKRMVLQRDRPLPIWGWADPGEDVTVKLDIATATTKSDAQGNWKVVLPAVKADGKAHTMTIKGKNEIKLEDILIGEVWVCSGQSNMEKPIGPHPGQQPCLDWQKEIAAADYPQIRLLEVPPAHAAKPASDADCKWLPCSPANIVIKRGGGHGYSACAYYFGRELQKALKVPIGLMAASVGGTRCEPWTPSQISGQPGGDLYNGMIAPLTPMAIRGVIWYQGESNVGDGLAYADKMKALIGGWRRAWGYDFPFYFVQIAPFAGYGPGALPPIWEAQMASLQIPKTGMSVTTDLVQNIGDIHPNNKIDVGNRLALWALAKEYGKKNLVYSGPLFKSMKVDGNKIRLTFAHVGGGLKSRDGKPLSEFEIAGTDGKFVAAEATIDNDTIIVQAKAVAAPTQVRFGWRNTANPNLVNKEGLPGSPFQTNNWQGGTGE